MTRREKAAAITGFRLSGRGEACVCLVVGESDESFVSFSYLLRLHQATANHWSLTEVKVK